MRGAGRTGVPHFPLVGRRGDAWRLLTTTGQAFVLDSRTLTPLAVLTRARGRYTEVALSADGSVAAAASDIDGELDIWNVGSHALIRALDLAPSWPTLGGALAALHGRGAGRNGGRNEHRGRGSRDRVHPTAAGQPHRDRALLRQRGPRAGLRGRPLLVGGNGLWADRYREPGHGVGRDAAVQHDDIYGTDQLEASADGTTLLTFGHGELAVWDVATRRKRVLPQPAWEEGTFKVYGLSADGRGMRDVVVRQPDRLVPATSNESMTPVVEEIRLDGASTRPYGWSSQERLLIVEAASEGGTVALAAANIASTKVVARGCSSSPGGAVAFSADGARLRARVSSGVEDAEGIYDAATGRWVGKTMSGPKWSVDGGLDLWLALVTGLAVERLDERARRERDGDQAGTPQAGRRRSRAHGLGVAQPELRGGDRISPDSRSLAVVDGPDHLLTILDTETGGPESVGSRWLA